MGIVSTLRDYFGMPEIEERAKSTSFTPPPRAAVDTTVSAREAMSLAMVYRAINIHVTAAKQMSLHVTKDDVEVPAPTFIRQPDMSKTRAAFIEETVTSLYGHGNAYWKITRDNQGRVQNLEVLASQWMAVNQDQYGKVINYQYANVTYQPSEIQHLTLMRIPGNAVGLGPIQAAQKEIYGAKSVRDYGTQWFDNSGVPNGVLKSDQVLSPDQAQAAKDAWNASAGAKNGVAILGNGLNYTPVYLSPADAQFLEVQNFNVTQIARLFGVPSSLMLADVTGTSMTYQNVEQDWIGFIRFGCPWIVEIEQAFSSLLPGRNEVEFNIDKLLRSDTLTRYNAHKIAIEAGFMTADEVRALEDLAPMTPGVVTNDPTA
jgi:HK97 family phage portal protein